MLKKILLVEDSKEVIPMIKQALGSAMELEWSQSIREAQDKLDTSSYSLILLDIELPDGNGIDLCTKIHAASPSTPVFFLTAHDNLSEKVLGFSAGADDYITKPFEPLELKARIEAKLSKIELLNDSLTNLKWKELEIYRKKQEVRVLDRDQYKPIELTALEYKILTYFAEKPGDVLDRDQILNDIWGKNIYVYPRSVDTHVSKLRRKLGPVAHVIESVHGVGYKFVPTFLNVQ
ncbi:MAG: response regulator transcription factor [Halobacteriovoraceae bacterium]|nr:response regulator transcription factor [Halobacteriovoraceae bacterium]